MEQQLLEKIKTRLESEKQEIIGELGRIAVQSKENPNKWEGKFVSSGNEAGHDEPGIMADETEEYGQRQSVAESLSQKLAEIDLALGKIARDTYGKCENCAGDIPFERLEAFPEARVCLDCRDGQKAV